MTSAASEFLRVLERVWYGFWQVFAVWTPLPDPVVTWNLGHGRFPRIAAWLHSDRAFWLLAIGVFGIGYGSADGQGALAVLVGAIAVLSFVAARYSVIVGWRIAFMGAALAVIFQLGVDSPGVAGVVAVGFPLFTVVVAARYERPLGLWAWVATVPIVAGVLMEEPGIVAILIGLVALVTDVIRSRRVGVQELTAVRERADTERAMRVTVEERARIARELHDVVAHHMSMVAVRAETAPYRIEGLSEEVRSEFVEISNTARESLNEIRGLLGVLRDDDTPRMPQPDLNQLDDLVESARGAGADVEVRVSGRRRPLRPAVELSAYRILQESLANVTRHAPGETAQVWIDYGEGELGLMVANPSTDAVGEPGHGMTGMQERAMAVNGTVTASRRADGRFVVEATLPVEP